VSGSDARRRVIEWGLSKEVRKGDVICLFSSLASSSLEGRNMAWEYMRSNWSHLMVMLLSLLRQS
jgi:hypothetical protein